jgi:hypothetical protein
VSDAKNRAALASLFAKNGEVLVELSKSLMQGAQDVRATPGKDLIVLVLPLDDANSLSVHALSAGRLCELVASRPDLIAEVDKDVTRVSDQIRRPGETRQ